MHEPRALIRDIVAYAAVALLSFCLLSRQPVATWQFSSLVLVYAAYVVACARARHEARPCAARAKETEMRDLPGTPESRGSASVALLLGVSGKRGWDLAAAGLRSPVLALLHGTMPVPRAAADKDSAAPRFVSRRHALVLSVTSPPFFLAAFGLWDAGIIICLALWAAGTACLAAASIRAAAAEGKRTCSEASGRESGSPQPLISTSGPLVACWALTLSVAWLLAVAQEAVALFQAIGRAAGVSEVLLGATVMAWGQGIPDAVAALSAASAGKTEMAVASCFGGPIFGLGMAFGLPATLRTLAPSRPSAGHAMTESLQLLYLSLGLVLLALATLLPLAYRWVFDRRGALCIGLMYLVSQCLFVAVIWGAL
ncbi:hypothetical protein QBZ16_000060 [Prototheca wickerhamii]|uniref:Sodium/calcium exchanger membrane region domain-containing protein n=1 Tax=Prototheca wickerhamii TaxID=3111 RepID=A0AAD9MJP1_PROWI|nr:hypothetical protein QBZ16_000060 [Prototheca wickerhamii]